ncbi:MAG TPA: 5'-3' exonuclease, partial [Candidatus Peribacteria bacterium]|nr:5'-3' exonuclease [Candidatus Peribacteria bacterium]
MKHLVIIDGHHLLYRAYWAIPRNMKNSQGIQVNTAFGFASMFMNILKTEQPDSVLFCFDADEKTFRHLQYEEYKAGRSPTPEDFHPQVPGVLRLVDAMGIKRVEGGGFEADDYACAYARAAEKNGDRVTIISGDRDLFQLVSDTIRVAIPHKGYQMPEYLGPKEVETKYGVTPAQIPSYKGLVGDSSDNLHGVMGIGPKAAAALLQKYGSLENLYANLKDVKESWRTKLEADRESAFFCAKMAELVYDIPLPLGLAELELRDL